MLVATKQSNKKFTNKNRDHGNYGIATEWATRKTILPPVLLHTYMAYKTLCSQPIGAKAHYLAESEPKLSRPNHFRHESNGSY